MFVILFSVTEAVNHYNQGVPTISHELLQSLLDPQQNHIPGYVPELVRDMDTQGLYTSCRLVL